MCLLESNTPFTFYDTEENSGFSECIRKAQAKLSQNINIMYI